MKHKNTKPILEPLLDALPSNNGGSDQKLFGHDRLRNGSGANSEERGSVAHTYPASLNDWLDKHAEGIKQNITKAKQQAQQDGREWQLIADRYTKNVLADCQDRTVKPETASKYQREFELLVEQNVTAYEKANSVQQWNLLRTASRFCLESEIRRLRRESEQARKSKDILLAQEKTLEAFRLAVALDEQFLSVNKKTWIDKKSELARGGKKPTNNSKRATRTPPNDLVGVLLATTAHRGWGVAERHAERLAVLALSGCRPSELKQGVELRLGKHGQLIFKVLGAKCDEQRGQEKRFIAMKPNCSLSRALVEICKQSGGSKVISMTDADHKSLNRALKAHGLSCYSFRHAFGTELKNAIATGVMKPQEAAKAMGHASVKSVTYYGRTSRIRGGRKLFVRAKRDVKTIPVTREQKRVARNEKIDWKNFRFPEKPKNQVVKGEKSIGVKSKPMQLVPPKSFQL